MTWMIRHAKSTLNHLRHSGERPQVCGITCCLRSPQKHLLQFLLLLRRQPSWTSRMRFGAQGLQSPFLQILLPSRYRRRCGLDQPGDLSHSLPFQEQLTCYNATRFQRLCTSFWSHSTRYYTAESVPMEKRRSIEEHDPSLHIDAHTADAGSGRQSVAGRWTVVQRERL
jgi:hypothetical protein